ncbi:MAG: response regulator [Phycisphaerales bacterium]|nr:response regulator [Phycisphaerales bacterium]
MTERRPKLLLIAESTDASGIPEDLARRYDVTLSTPDQAPIHLRSGGFDLVLTHPEVAYGVHARMIGEHARTLLNAMGEGACLSDAAGVVRWGNEMYRSYSTALHEHIGELCRQATTHFNALLSRHGRIRRGHGKRYTVGIKEEQRYFEVLITPVVSPAGEDTPGADVSRVAVVVRESTARRQMQSKIDAIVKAGRELAHIDVETVRRMHAADRLKLLEEKVIRYAHDILNFDHFAVRLLNKSTNALDLVMSYGLSEDAKDVALKAESEGNGISGFVAATGWSYICPDAAKDDRYVFGLEICGSSLTVPIKLFDEVIGVFNVESAEVNAFGEADRQFAEIFAHSLAMALHILNLLLVERSATKEAASGTMEGELEGPLADLVAEAEILLDQAGDDEARSHLRRILRDVDSIRRRVRNVARGPQTLLGIDEALEGTTIDPLLDGRHVLVVDNEPNVLELVDTLLTRCGCDVEMCCTGADGIAAIERAADGSDPSGPFDLVISDISLGDKTGYDVFAAIKRVTPDAPVILMTGFGYDPHHSIVRASQEGLQSVLFKPFKAEKLIEEVKAAVKVGVGTRD